MTFRIRVIINGKEMLFPVQKIDTTETTETYSISIRDRSISLQTNRLLFHGKNLEQGQGQADWKVIDGQFTSPSALQPITEAIERADPLKL
jgi:hypothetical protein